MTQMVKCQLIDTGDMKKQGIIASLSDNSFLEIDHYLKETHEIPEKEFNLMILRKCNKLQEMQIIKRNDKTIPDINEKFNKEL